MKRTAPIVLAVAVMVLVTTLPTRGQTTGRLRGMVVDPEGSAIPGVTVSIYSSVLMGGERMAVTGDTGAYSFTGLPPGLYSVAAELQGLLPAKQEHLQVGINTTSTVNFMLKFAEEMTVTGEAPLVDVSSSSLATNLNSSLLQDLPTDRWFVNTLGLTTGVSSDISGTGHLSAFGSDLQSNSWRVDGIGVSSPTTGSSWIQFNPAIVEEAQVMGVGAPAEFGNLQGAALNVVTKSGSNRLRGTLDAYWFNDALVDSDIGFEESEFSEYTQVHPFWDLSASLGGPIKQDRLWYFFAYENLQSGAAAPGTDPTSVGPASGEAYDLKLSGRVNDRNLLDLRIGSRSDVWSAGSSEFIEPSAAAEEGMDPAYWALNYQSLFSDRTFLEARYSGWFSEFRRQSQTGSTEPAYIDLSPAEGGPARFFGGMLWPFLIDQASDQASVTLSHFADDFLAGDHDFKFGIQVNLGEENMRLSPSAAGSYYTHYGAYYGGDLFIRVEGSPYYFGSEKEVWGAFVDDSWALSDRLTLNLGLRFDRAQAIVPPFPILNSDGSSTGGKTRALDPAFTWNNWSPRVGFAYDLGATRRTVIRGSFGVYYDDIVGGAFHHPPTYTPTMYFSTGPSWNGPWGSQGVRFSEGLTTAVDPKLRTPRTLQYSLGFEREFGSVYSAGAQIVYKDSRDGIGWQILDDGVYETLDWTDPFTGQQYTLLNPTDDGFPTIRKGNGPGFTVDGQLDNYWSEYKGLILTFNRRFADWWGLQASYTLSDSRGITPWVLSGLQWGLVLNSKNGSHPNQWLNVGRGRTLLNDRPHMFRVLANWKLPWNLHASTVVNLQSGRPLARQARVFYSSISFDQTNFIAAPTEGQQRLDFQSLIDFSIGKRWQLPGRFLLKTDLQFFNLLNSTAVEYVADQVLSEGDEFVPSAWVLPRRLMLRIGLEY